MSSKIIKPRKGKWIVKLEKLQECQDCHDFFTDSLTFKEHLKDHQQETRIDIESQKIKYQAIENESEGTSKSKLLQVYNEIFNENGEKVFQCKECANVYSTKNSLHKHYASSHREKKFKCDKCSKMFSAKSAQKRHYRNCNGMVFQSQIKNDKMKKMFIKEIINVDGSNGFQCIKCSSVYKKKGSACKHFQTVHREKRFKCDKCSKMFPIQSILRYHMKTCSREISETKILKFKCDKCKKLFSKMSSLKKHLKICNRIDSPEETKFDHLKNHEIFSVNHQEDVARREHFETSSRSKTKGVVHKEVLESNNGSEFQCKHCDRTFKSRRLVCEHFNSFHSEKKFKCDLCGKQFAFQSKLGIHIESCGIDLQCNHCDRTFKTLKGLQIHCILVHKEKKFNCDKCSKLFIKSKLEFHMKQCSNSKVFKIMNTDQGKNYQCNTCQKIFVKLSTFHTHHNISHTEKPNGETEFKCSKCNRKFFFQNKA